MKAILIDSINREVKEVEIGKGIDEMYKFLQCECFTIASYLDKQDAIFVDDEGLMNGTDSFFTYEGAHQPFAGNGLIMGCDDMGESEDCKVGDKITIKGLSYSTIMGIAKNNTELHSITITKQYEKKIK